ncbi:MAG: InlB B-repeat-containing protein [Clostridia bacterium]|nr:InlB B-repeat-containing protein [Clostridia bacterium]
MSNMKKKIFLFLAVICITCLFICSISASEHIVTEEYTYENGFTSEGTYSKACSCGDSACENNVASTEKPPLFTIYGFSMPEMDTSSRGFSYSYKADIELVEEYERINNCDITYGFLLSGANNYESNPNKISTAEFDKHYSCIDIRINYGAVDENGCTKYDRYDVIFAGRVTVKYENGESETLYFQPNLATRVYSNDTFGKLFGANYDLVAKTQNEKTVWLDNTTVNSASGELEVNSGTSASESFIKVNKEDIIRMPSGEDCQFMLYGYNYLNGEYQYVGYIDCNSDVDTGDNENLGTSYTFRDNSLICVNGQENVTEEIDYNNFYVRMVVKSSVDENITYESFCDDVMFNLVEDSHKKATVIFKNGDNTTEKECIVGNKLGKLPIVEKENHVFMGWYREDDTSILYDEETIVDSSCVLIPVFREYVTDVKDYIEWSQSYIVDNTGAYLASDASRYIVTSFIKVNEGDSIVFPQGNGHRFVIYCYSDQYGTYEANSIIDCNTDDSTSSYENWGYSYTFKNGDILENGSELNCDNLYIRIAFRKDDSGNNGSVDIDTIKNNVVFNISADNYHLIADKVACEHQFGAWQVLQERNCLVDGIDARDCTLCALREVRYTQATGHKAVIDPAIEANCGVDGYTEGSHCGVCGIVLKAPQIISKDGLHQYNELVALTQAPTTTAEGKGTFKCIVCGATREETIAKVVSGSIGKDYIQSITSDEFNPALDNAWKVVDGNKTTSGIYVAGNDWFGNVGDTLVITLDREITLNSLTMYISGNYTYAKVVIKNAQGNTVKTNSVLANVSDSTETKSVFTNQSLKAKTIEITITSLKWTDRPTCIYTFKVAEIEMTGTVQDPRLPHTHVFNEFVKTTKEATCQEAGSDQYKCYCGMVTEKATSKIDHSYTVLSSVKEATCVENGAEVYKCQYCAQATTVTLDKVGHIFAKVVAYVTHPTNGKDGEAIFKCINCDQTENRTVQALELGKVEHLRVEKIENGTVTLLFNVYGEQANYEVRYSTSEITNDNFASATVANATVIGDKEYTVTLNMNANLNNCYYVAIRPYIGENYGEASAIRVGGNKLIPIDYHSGNVYSGEVLNSFAKLFDEQSAERTKIPTSVLSRVITDKNDAVLYDMNLSPIVDLEYMHYVSNVYLYFASAGANIKVRWSDTPVDAYADNSKWDGNYETTSTQGWNEFKVDETTRYIQIIFQDGSAPYEMLVYGFQNGEGDEVATSIGGLPTMGEMMGMCGFVAGGGGNTPIDSVSCTTVLREYHNFGWSYSLTAYPGKASFFNTSWMANFDSQYLSYKRAGINVIPCVQWDLVNIPQSNQVDENNLPIKSDGSFVKSDFWGKMNPHTYFMYADSMFAFAARYGSNSSTDLLNTLALHASDTNKVGLNCLEWIEMGNEPEGAWNGIHNYYSAYQLAALTSAAYDGHCRTMVSSVMDSGYHLGLKNADPNMKAAMAGVSAVSNEYITSLCYWMKANRPDGKIAFDAFNVHCYMTKTITLPNDSNATVGISPEEAGIVDTLSQLIAIRDKYYPEKEVWITEFGWDTNQSYATSTSAHAYSNEKTGVSYTGREVQAMWLTRTYLLLSASGIDKATMYMCEDCGVEEVSVGKYGTAGVIGYKYDENGNTVEFKKDSYYYLYTLKNTLGDYTFNEEIEAYDENVMIYEYKTKEGKTAYAVWCTTSDGTVSNNYQLKIDGASATIVENENGNVYGKKTDVSADSLGYISVNVSEKPVYILVD